MAQSRIEPFRIEVADEVLADLFERLSRTRWPDEIPGSGWEYGANLAYLKELVDYWRRGYDWRIHERERNALPQFRAPVDGLQIHFIHARGHGRDPKPLLLLHGWPGSVYEFARIIPMLVDPEENGAEGADSFTVVAPSLPGYGFSDRPRAPAMNVQAIAEIMSRLMTEVLGYRRFGVQGGDWGSAIASRLGEAHGENLYGIHLNMIPLGSADANRSSELSEEEKVFLADLDRFRREESGYQWIQGTRPQTLAYALNDSPVGLAAWMVEKFRAWSDCRGDVERRFTRDQLLTNVMIYWVTESINSSIRLYYEARHHPWRLRPDSRIETPTGVAVFPRELFRPPRSWAERAYNIRRWTVMPSGGHFAAMEEPGLLAEDIRAFFHELG